ncbi:hypothetical protein [Mesorhizobium sp.]|uniref:hypothetical protein n=1 Tax=Mesorhizobium sp. TaxID=1871066 RepID=UPI0025DF2052|nr:hypothetical protein [Mesorhizobium sp.]
MAEALNYLDTGESIHVLNTASLAKSCLIRWFTEVTLGQCSLLYKFQLLDPTGTNDLEAPLKIVRKFTGPHRFVSFANDRQTLPHWFHVLDRPVRANV